MSRLHKEEILRLIYNSELTAEEGLQLYRKLAEAPKSISSRKREGVSKEENSVERVQLAMDIAVIGVAGQFPGAKDTEEYWNNLVQGKDCITEITRWDPDQFYDPDPKIKNKSYCKEGGFLSDIDQFDPLFFNITPKQAELMDPRQRLFLQEAWKVIEDAGYSNKQLEGTKCGVFVGCEGEADYFAAYKNEQNELTAEYFLGNSNSILASRIAYFMDLHGPTITIDTACSSSLIAIHLACESIRTANCEVAIAGGVSLYTIPHGYVLASKLGMLSPDGRCKAFDHRANGFVPGEAVGVVFLKPLKKALADKDHIYGVIKGSGMNQDGKTNGITAPSARSQSRLEIEVYEKTGIHPETITYIEAHGTGTKLGDPIEFQALKTSFEKYTEKKQFCGLGSVKTNIGHTGASAGVSGLIKVLLALKNKTLPPSLHFKEENEQINFSVSPFFMVTKLQPWATQEEKPRRAAISSFGHSGTNCHMIIEQAPDVSDDSRSLTVPYYLLAVSAKTKESMNQKWEDLYTWLETNKKPFDLQDISFTLLTGRSHFKYRSALIVKDLNDLKNRLKQICHSGSTEGYYLSDSSKGIDIQDKVQEFGQKMIKELAESVSTETNYKNKLGTLANLYVNQYELNWEYLFASLRVKRIPMPTYPFMQKRYWLPTEAITPSDPAQDRQKNETIWEMDDLGILETLRQFEKGNITEEEVEGLLGG